MNTLIYLQSVSNSFKGKYPLYGKQKKMENVFSFTIAYQILYLQFIRDDLGNLSDPLPRFFTSKGREADFIHYQSISV